MTPASTPVAWPREGQWLLPVLATFVYLAASFLSGHLWRFPFDDEIFTIDVIGLTQSITHLLAFFAQAQDVHPSGSYIFFYVLRVLGLPPESWRYVSLLMSAGAVWLAARVLQIAAQDRIAPPAPVTELLCALCLGLTPMVVSQGDAVRWYPLFLLLTLAAIRWLLLGRLALAALCFGLSASVNFLGFVSGFTVLLLVWSQQGWRRALSLPVLAGFLAGAALGFVTLYKALSQSFGEYAGGQFRDTFFSIAASVVGLVGGHSTGVIISAGILALYLAAVLLAWRTVPRLQPNAAIKTLLWLLAPLLALVLVGFFKPRSFIHAALLLNILLALWGLWLTQQQPRRAVIFWVLVLCAELATLPALNGSTAPFKRTTSVPYDEIIELVRQTPGTRQLYTSDPALRWLVKREVRDACVITGSWERCPTEGIDRIILVLGHSSNPHLPGQLRKRVETFTQGRKPVATVYYGYDREAGLKSQLSGRALDDFTLSAEIYDLTKPPP